MYKDPENILPRLDGLYEGLEYGSSMEVENIRKDRSLIEESIKKRKLDLSVLDRFYDKDKEWRSLVKDLDALRAEKNRISEQINKNRDKRDELIKKASELDSRVRELEEKERRVSEEREKALFSLPNLVHPKWPLDKEEEVFVYGKPKVLKANEEDFIKQFGSRDHIIANNVMSQYDIIREYDLADEERGSELAGPRFYYMKNDLVLLDNALALYALKMLREQGFKMVIPPYLVKRYVEERATSFDAFEETLYKIEGEDLYLIPTAEHPIAAYNADRLLDEDELPLRYGGFSASFRKEAGAHGKDTKGIFRNHHFNKVEQYIVCKKDQVEAELNRVMNNQARLIRDLNIPFRVIKVPAFDMDKKALFQFDIEGWFPAQNRYRELGSHASVGTWQAVRFNIKYYDKNEKEKRYVHTIYSTLVPIERMLSALLENNLQEDGRIVVPKVLADLVGFDEIKPVR
ncbi:MAG: serine--tRNA ligase [Candidatus Micrarchaeota archaeon]|nr:MAG: serine--tRNA ligase [Candidatus Micrarchaeota archaeon]